MFVCVRACVWCDRPPAISESTPKPKCEDITNSYQDTLLDFVSKHFDLHCLRQCKTKSSKQKSIICNCTYVHTQMECCATQRAFVDLSRGVCAQALSSKGSRHTGTKRWERHSRIAAFARPGHAVCARKRGQTRARDTQGQKD